jgi:hypothetical protein
MPDDADVREACEREVAAYTERLDQVRRLIKEGKVRVGASRVSRLHERGCIADYGKELQNEMRRMCEQDAAPDVAGWKKRWLITALWLGLFWAVVFGATYGVYQMGR